MKIQNLAIVFVIIVIPISLVLGYYLRSEIDTLKLQMDYDEKLSSAAYDAVKAYQINTANNPYSIVNGSQKRDIEASINAFMNSFATGLGVSGYGENYIKPYVPAILFTLYDGYYIYAPTFNYDDSSNQYEHLLKPYVTYTQHYKKGNVDVLVSYTLDNYITVTGIVNGKYESKSGYLVNSYINLPEEELSEDLFIYDDTGGGIKEEYRYIYDGGENIYYDATSADPLGRNWFLYRNGKKVYINTDSSIQLNDKNAKTYGEDAQSFTQWVKNNLGSITINDLILDDGVRSRNQNDIYKGNNGTDRIFNPDTNDFESESSIFNIHKKNMIKISIKENLSAAITNYSAHSGALGTNADFQMPILEESEWEQITKNVCMVAFVQGMPVGFKTYNNYAIIANTRNQNYTDRDSLAFIESDTSEYHRIDCPFLNAGASIQGYRKIDFEPATVEVITDYVRENRYYYKHTNLPCYYCMVARNYTSEPITGNRLQALNRVLGRYRNMLHY